MIYKKHQQSGFSLVETLVSITILLVVIVGPMSISSTANRSGAFSDEQVIATYLAEEGAEIAQKVRDDMIIKFFTSPQLEPTPWNDFMDSTGQFQLCFNSTGCGLELETDSKGTLDSTIRDCGGNGSACRLYLDPNNQRARYTHDGSGGKLLTEYSRVIYFEDVGLPGELKVTSRVYWRSGNQRTAQEVEVVTFLFNVYERYGT